RKRRTSLSDDSPVPLTSKRIRINRTVERFVATIHSSCQNQDSAVVGAAEIKLLLHRKTLFQFAVKNLIDLFIRSPEQPDPGGRIGEESCEFVSSTCGLRSQPAGIAQQDFRVPPTEMIRDFSGEVHFPKSTGSVVQEQVVVYCGATQAGEHQDVAWSAMLEDILCRVLVRVPGWCTKLYDFLAGCNPIQSSRQEHRVAKAHQQVARGKLGQRPAQQ